MISYQKTRRFDSDIHIFTINQYAGSKVKLLTTPGNKLYYPSQFQAQDHPDLLVNGGLFNMATGFAIGENVPFPEPRPVLAVNRFGNAYVRMAKSPDDFFAMEGGFFLMAYGLLLDPRGEIDIIGRADYTFAPRTLAGVRLDGCLMLVAVEGRSKINKGCSIWQAAKLMQDLGCRRGAVNLDGGGSTQVIYQGLEVVKSSDTHPRRLANMIGVWG